MVPTNYPNYIYLYIPFLCYNVCLTLRCNVFKAASSSWMYNFNLMANYSAKFLERSREVPLVLARRRYPRPSVDELKEAQNTSTTFIIVRHPFERLSSAYKDKLQFALPNSLHSRLGMKIILKYRPGAKVIYKICFVFIL